MSKLLQLLKDRKGAILYIVFGVLTTLINWITYYVFFDICRFSNVIATIFAWLFAIVFAFITNKIWVFESKSFETKRLVKEAASFLAVRAATGLLDVVIMFVSVDLLNSNAYVWKILSNVVIIISNYALSKLIVFKKEKRNTP